jgi:hypothetical protein
LPGWLRWAPPWADAISFIAMFSVFINIIDDISDAPADALRWALLILPAPCLLADFQLRYGERH